MRQLDAMCIGERRNRGLRRRGSVRQNRAGLLPPLSFLPPPLRKSLKWAARAAGLSDVAKGIAR
jgi:hypothetical protein